MIRLEQLRYTAGSFTLDDISLEVQDGEYFVLLGPSGSGKTLLLECLCGLNRIDRGTIHLGSDDVTHWEPRHRGIGYLPQDYALFPHQTVRRNIAYGLRFQGLERPELSRRVEALMRLCGVDRLANRRPRHLSGGEKQRVALARALAIRPKVLLLDEPVSALDEQTRDVLCRQLKRLQSQSKTTTVHVCHNFAEMLTVADRVAILHGGHILQVGSPQDILERPKNRLIASFVQSGNLFKAHAYADGSMGRLVCSGGIEFFTSSRPEKIDQDVEFIIRPENVDLQTEPFDASISGSTQVEGTIRELVDAGAVVRVAVDSGRNLELLISMGKKEYNRQRLGMGQQVFITISADDVHVLEG